MTDTMPTPWTVKGRDSAAQYITIEAANGRTIARMFTNNGAAELFAAAPETAAERDRLLAVNEDLLAAAQFTEEFLTSTKIHTMSKGGFDCSSALEMLRTAIAEATP